MAATPLFEAIGHESLADAVVSQVEELIAAGVLKQGRKLPSERDLAERLKVSRPKLREALQKLEERGLVQTTHGEGTFVSALTGQAMMPALMALYGRHEPAFYDYLEYRREQEGFAARLAAKRATVADKERIQGILNELQRAWETQDTEASRTADFALHAAVVDASHNATLIHVMASIFELSRRHVFYNRDFLTTIDGSGVKLLKQHLALGQAIIDGDAVRAEQAAVDHITFVEKSFRLAVQQQQREAMAEKRRLIS